MQEGDSRGRFVYEDAPAAPARTVLYDKHLEGTGSSRIAAFAGYLMPLWYSSISDEHAAVRWTAGLFDCTHMGVLSITGSDAAEFLDFVLTNRVASLEAGRARYAYVLDAAGSILDDVIVYRLADQDFMLVVNAANEPKIKAYFEALPAGRVCIDADDAARSLQYRPQIADLRDPGQGERSKVDLALQGPASLTILARVLDDAAPDRLAQLKPFALLECRINGRSCLIARTGYTGAKMGFELFVHPGDAPQIWTLLLERGEPCGLRPCGLGARDSLRIEAGLPLYGHELAGPHDISPFQAGYGWAVKLDKGFFIGQAAMRRAAEELDMIVARIELPGEKGVRPLRSEDAILDAAGRCVGWILSCAKVSDRQISQVYIDAEQARPGNHLGAYYLARKPRQIEQGRLAKVEKDQVVTADLQGAVIDRFAKF